MAVLFDKDKKELIVTCSDGCDNGLHIRVATNKYGAYCDDDFSWISYTNGNFYRDQQGVWETFKKKIKKIWAIIRNRDIYYSDILMTREDFEQFREFVNSVELE